MHPSGACAKIRDMHQLAPTQGRILWGSPSSALLAHLGSAIKARAMPTKSHCPSASQASASSGLVIRPTPTTGTVSPFLILPVAFSWNP